MRRILTILMFVSLIPALLIAWQRIRAEQGNKVVAIVMDYPSLKAQAGLLGKPTQALLAHYQKEGVNGVGVYEDSVQSRILEGKAAYASGSSLLAKHPGAAVHPSWTYLRSLAPGTVAQLRSRYRSPSQVLQIGKQRWTGWPVDIRGLPAGAPMRLLRSLHRRGLLVVYRPFYSSLERHLGRLLPPAHLAPFLAFLGSSVPGAGNHQLLAAYSQKLSGRTLAPIGFNAQTGMLSLASQHPAVQLFSLPSNYLATLSPQSASLKYVLGAANRSYRLLYLHPYTSVKSTDLLIRSVVAGLKAHGFTIGTPQPVSFVPNHTLQRLSLIGPLLALVLLALSYRLRWLGVAVAVLVVLLAVADAGHTLAGGALMAGLTFPVLGLVNRRERPVDWVTATLYTLSGAMFAQAMGVSRLGMLALSPYRGVALVLTEAVHDAALADDSAGQQDRVDPAHEGAVQADQGQRMPDQLLEAGADHVVLQQAAHLELQPRSP